MAVTADTRIIPEDLQVSRTRVRAALEKRLGAGSGQPHV